MNTSPIAQHLHRAFATDQTWHAIQQADGTYRKKYGQANPRLFERILAGKQSVACYQKNADRTLKWICFDFDVLKSYLETKGFENGKSELKQAVRAFCLNLDSFSIPYLLEFSGNRGFHVWVTFEESVPHSLGYQIQQLILEEAGPQYDKNIISLDLFPSSATPTDGVGVCVKVPLSKHTKSLRYALLLSSVDDIDDVLVTDELNDDLIARQVAILAAHQGATVQDIESALDVVFETEEEEVVAPIRAKSIFVEHDGFTLELLLQHWQHQEPLARLAEKIGAKTDLNGKERRLLVGLLANVKTTKGEPIGYTRLVEIFARSENYNPAVTEASIKKFSSYHFPSAKKIEEITGGKFDGELAVSELLGTVLPKFNSFDDATFVMSQRDIAAISVAESNYLFVNDEVQCRFVVDELSSIPNERKRSKIAALVTSPTSVKFYKHNRDEGGKTRSLVSLGAAERIFTSFVMRQFAYIYDLPRSENSHGYQINRGFKGGFIFRPWLYMWIKFVANVNSFIEDPDNAEFYIVKTDVSSFYDTVPHDNLKRLLLGGANPRIDASLRQLSEKNAHLYRHHVDILFAITEKIMGGRNGLPQGPAYARYFAELYLDNTDNNFAQKIEEKSVLLYQRYVDDIFFVCASEQEALRMLSRLRTELQVIGLSLNDEKTKVTKIAHFGAEFDLYRSQSKYIIDRSSRNFIDATDEQQDAALAEFASMLAQDNFDDLSFVFTHLSGVAELDQWKRDKFVEIISAGVGRGSLFKHMFDFALESQENWSVLRQIEAFSELQSEVLTATIINMLELGKENGATVLKLLIEIVDKLAITEAVQEHLAYLVVIHQAAVPLTKISPISILKCSRVTQNLDRIHVNSEILAHVNSELNNIQDLGEFVESLYPFCASRKTLGHDLNELASVFYAKIGADEMNGNLDVARPVAITSCETALRFYYLVCIFSASNRNESNDLLKSMWKYCTHTVNLACDSDALYSGPSWYAKIDQIEMHQGKAQLILTSIVDGSIFRGLIDKFSIFERFHNVFLLYIAFRDPSVYSEQVAERLKELQGKGKFFDWLINRENVRLFPSLNRVWFERNLAENDEIILQREREVMFRKPTSEFRGTIPPINEHNGYSEIIVPYVSANYCSFRERVESYSVRERLVLLVELLGLSNVDQLPNIFCSERILHSSSLHPFADEMMHSKSLIVEDFCGNVSVLENTRDNFVTAFFDVFSPGDIFKRFKQKYIDNLPRSASRANFISAFVAQFLQIGGAETEFYYDIAFASAFYVSLRDLSVAKRIETFIEHYHLFNPGVQDRHVYTVKKTLKLEDCSPERILMSIEDALSLLQEESVPSLGLFLRHDIKEYRLDLQKLAENNDVSEELLRLGDFTRTDARVQASSNSVRIGGTNYPVGSVYIFDLKNRSVSKLGVLNRPDPGATHVYYKVAKDKVFIIWIDISISKIFNSLETRLAALPEQEAQSYPSVPFSTSDIQNLQQFHLAVENVAAHRGAAIAEAERILIDWLRYLPKGQHQMLVTLIAAHVVMRKTQIDEFVARVGQLIKDEDSNPFLIKRVGDYNGTHRLLYLNPFLGRSVDSLSPVNIRARAQKATIIVDNIISGGQVAKAIEFYCGAKAASRHANYFNLTQAESSVVATRMKGLQELNLCTVLYTQAGLAKIRDVCQQLIGVHVQVNVIEGTDIRDDGLFGTTSKIGESEKERIRSILGDKDQMMLLSQNLKSDAKLRTRDYTSDDEINKTNLLARYRSLPKKCFDFLHISTRHQEDCHPFIRVLELNEKK